MASCATLLLFLAIPLLAGADVQNLVPPGPDLPASIVPTVLPSADAQEPLKVGAPVDEVVKGIVAPSQSPPPQGGGQPGENPTPPGNGGGGGGGGEQHGSGPGQKPGGGNAKHPVTGGVPAGGSKPDSMLSKTVLAGVPKRVVWRAVSPSLGTLANRAGGLMAPLAAPMGLGIVAVMLLGLATRGPGVISKLNEELESADGRQVWRL